MHNMTYRHCITAGSSYEVGFQLGSQLQSDKDLIKDLTTPLFGGQPLPKEMVEKTSALFEKYIPGINEEIKGFSDAVGVSYSDMVIYSSYINLNGGCSHFIVLRDDKAQRKIYHARNYDYNYDERPILITSRTNGKNHNTGFGCKIFGRFDGMNNHGLCVSTSSVDLNHTGRIGNGFVFPMVIRAMLEQCSSVYEAKEMFMEMPYAEYRNFLLSDKSGAGVIIEASPIKKSCRNIEIDSGYGFLCSSNHFTLNSCDEIKPVKNSLIRQARMEEVLKGKRDIALDDIKAILSTRYPDGLAFPYYTSGMGTLWSIIFDPVTLSQYVCFGSPETGTWKLIDQNEALGCNETVVQLNNVEAPNDLY